MLDVRPLSFCKDGRIESKNACVPFTPLAIWRAKHLQDLQQLVFLEGHVLLRVEFRLLALEDRPQTGQLRDDAAHGPAVDGLVVVLRAHEQLRRAVPDRDDDLVPGEERLERLVRQAREPEVADFDDARGRDEDVRRLEVAVEDVGLVQVEEAVEELVYQGFEDRGRDLVAADGLGVMVYELLGRKSKEDRKTVHARETDEEIVLSVFKDHVDGLVLEYDLLERHDVFMRDLSVELHEWL